MTIDALNMLKKADDNGEKIYFHCTVGEDRTGHEAGNPKKNSTDVAKIRESLTPAFFTMVNIIQDAQKSRKKLTKSMCEDVEMVEVDPGYRCTKSNLL
jgi:hypothetical protein